MHKKVKALVKRGLILWITLLLFLLQSGTLFAVTSPPPSQDDINAIINDTVFYDPSTAGASGCTSASSAGQTATKNVADFVNKYGQGAYDNSLSSGVPYESTLAQAIIESAYGASQLTVQANNFFGIKADSSWTGGTISFPTKEFVNGSSITVNALFRKYATPQDSFLDHDNFLRNNSRYAGAFQYSHDPIQFIDAVAAAGYATSPTYAQTVGAVIQEIQTYIASTSKWPPSSQVTYTITAPHSVASTTDTSANPASCSCSAGGSPAATALDTSVVPQPYAQIFAQAGAKYGVAPAFIAAIFYGGEHGNSFPTPPPPYGTGAAWSTSSAGAQGPFQFEPRTWAQYGVDGNGDGKLDVQDLTDAAFGAAHYLANGLNAGNNTTDEQTLRQAAADYYGIHDPTAAYPSNVWAAFEKFNGSGGLTPASASSCDTTLAADSNAYRNPLRDVPNRGPARIDEGVDYTGDGPVHPLGPGTVDYVNTHTGWPGPSTFISYILSSGQDAGKRVYVAENCTNIQVQVGETVDSNSVLCTMNNTSPHIEMGWAEPASPNSSPQDHAAAHAVYRPDGTATAYGQDFDNLMIKLGAPAGTYDFPSLQSGGRNLTGTLPAGWPAW